MSRHLLPLHSVQSRALAVAIVLLGCTSCGAPDAPSSAGTPVVPTVEGLAKLFQRECIDQADLAWVQEQIDHRLWWDCFGDKSSDCFANDADSIEWKVPTTANSSIIVSVLTPELGKVPAPGQAQCSVYVSQNDVMALKAGISRLSVGGRGLVEQREPAVAGTNNGHDSNWRLSGNAQTTPDLVLSRPEESADCQPWGCCSSATYVSDYPCYPDKDHPWQLTYYPTEKAGSQ